MTLCDTTSTMSDAVHEPDSSNQEWDINDAKFPQPPSHPDKFELWPRGHVRHVYSATVEEARRHTSGWAMRNTNNHNVNLLKKSCLGVLLCTADCRLPGRPQGPAQRLTLRPAICDKARRKQCGRKCPNPQCTGGTVYLHPCRGHCGYPVTHLWRTEGEYIYFQANGCHDHPMPDLKPIRDQKRRTTPTTCDPTTGKRLAKSDMIDLPGKLPKLTCDTKNIKPESYTNYGDQLCSCPPFECLCSKSVSSSQKALNLLASAPSTLHRSVPSPATSVRHHMDSVLAPSAYSTPTTSSHQLSSFLPRSLVPYPSYTPYLSPLATRAPEHPYQHHNMSASLDQPVPGLPFPSALANTATAFHYPKSVYSDPGFLSRFMTSPPSYTKQHPYTATDASAIAAHLSPVQSAYQPTPGHPELSSLYFTNQSNSAGTSTGLSSGTNQVANSSSWSSTTPPSPTHAFLESSTGAYSQPPYSYHPTTSNAVSTGPYITTAFSLMAGSSAPNTPPHVSSSSSHEQSHPDDVIVTSSVLRQDQVQSYLDNKRQLECFQLPMLYRHDLF